MLFITVNENSQMNHEGIKSASDELLIERRIFLMIGICVLWGQYLFEK